MNLDRICRAWDRAGNHSDSFPDSLLERVGELLAERLEEIRSQPETILDLGCRNGLFWRQLQPTGKTKRRIVSTTLTSNSALRTMQGGLWQKIWRKRPEVICAHPLSLPFANQTFDAVVSNMMLHWINDRREAFKEIRRVLKSNGVLLFSIPGENTLTELRQSLAELDLQRDNRTWPHLLTLPSLQDLGDELLTLGFRLPVVDREVIHPTFNNVWTLLKHLRALGSCNPWEERKNTLTGKQYFSDLQDLYLARHHSANHALTATVEILFGHGWRD
ncbi:MAG: methyltransferase domain-containing protein [Magnetococcales bacterium]|nr:methyltransferase domain-containing protein [Magnetococcales bacterium]